MSLGFIKFDADTKKEGGSLTLTAVLKRSAPYHPAIRKMLSSYLKNSKELEAVEDLLEKLAFFTQNCPLPQLGGKNKKTPPSSPKAQPSNPLKGNLDNPPQKDRVEQEELKKAVEPPKLPKLP